MKRGLYRKLAFTGMKKNKESYLPYMLASACILALFYINLALTQSKELKNLAAMEQLQAILGMGMIIIGLFSMIFLFYTNNFLMRRRKNEFALYNILGMEKRHLAKVLLWENIYLATITILGGLCTGAVFYKLAEGFLFRVLGKRIETSYFPAVNNLLITAVVFLGIYGLIYLNSLRQLRKATPAELLREARSGDKAPKVNWLVALLAVLCLGAGYYIALTVPSPMQAIQKLMLAVVLVMMGTYFGFMALSVLVLKLLQRRKSYYYKTKNFTAVSGLLFRMKQNALGLANICILSTAVLVVLSSAAALHLGGEEIIQKAYPREAMITGEHLEENLIREQLDKVDQTLKAQGLTASKGIQFRNTNRFARLEEDKLSIVESSLVSTSVKDHVMLYIMPYEDVKGYLTEPLGLKEGEVAVFGVSPETKTLTLGKENFKVLPFEERPEFFKVSIDNIIKSVAVIVPSAKDLEKITEIDKDKLEGKKPTHFFYAFDLADQQGKVEGNREEVARKFLQEASIDKGFTLRTRETDRRDFRVVYGGIFFTGILLGIVFILAASLSIYYKQLTEGYEDRKRFQIMKKVGMTKEEIKATIGRQILLVFFLPLLTAGVHIGFAFPAIGKFLALLNLTNRRLHLYSMIGVFIAFTLLYTLVYLWTSKTYYGIVTVKEE